jgi:hypothetical protein
VEFHALRPDITFRDKTLHRRLTDPKRGLERIGCLTAHHWL